MKELVIEAKGFKLEQIEIGSKYWDLYIKKKVQHKDGTTSQEYKILMYGIPFTTALDAIILTRISAKHDEVFTLKEFFNAYAEERNDIIKAFNLETINLTRNLKEIKDGIREQNQTC